MRFTVTRKWPKKGLRVGRIFFFGGGGGGGEERKVFSMLGILRSCSHLLNIQLEFSAISMRK